METERPAPPSAPRRRSRRRLDRRALLVGAVVLGVVVVALLVVLFTRGGGDDEVSEADVRGRLEAAVAEAQRTAQRAEGEALDVVALRAELEEVADGWLIDLDAPSDRTRVGVAARRLDAPVCIFVWSAVGGPKSAVVSDPNLPCLGAIARIAAG